MAALTPVKVAAETDALISHAAHFLQRTKKDIVDAAVREYVDNHREEINAGVTDALDQLNATTPSAVALLTGMSATELEELGGLTT